MRTRVRDHSHARQGKRVERHPTMHAAFIPLPLGRPVTSDRFQFRADKPEAAPIHAIIDAVTARAWLGPTELTPDEIATLCPAPPDPKQLLQSQRMLPKVGITWPGSPAIPE